MHTDLDTLVVALYVTIDELLGPRRGPGRRPRLSDAELVCLAIAQVLLGFASERRWLRFAGHRLAHLFPLPADPVGLQPPAAPRRAPGRVGHQRAGGAHPKLVGPAAPGRLHPAAVRGLPPDGQALGAGRARRLRLLLAWKGHYRQKGILLAIASCPVKAQWAT